MSNEKGNLQRLLAIMARLRDPKEGCPWDKKQTFASIVPHTIEEAYEVADAIHQGNRDAIKDECGDLLFQVVFYAQLGKEEAAFDFDDIAKAISDKLERRHPHVFRQQTDLSETDLSEQWDNIKAAERTNAADNSVFDTIPSGLPSLKLAHKTQRACAKVGFDWPEPHAVLDKVKEEIGEIEQEMHATPLNNDALEEEIGDAFFALVNLARHYNIDADNALRKANAKFQKRFIGVEEKAKSAGKTLNDTSLEQMEDWWSVVKQQALSK